MSFSACRHVLAVLAVLLWAVLVPTPNGFSTEPPQQTKTSRAEPWLLYDIQAAVKASGYARRLGSIPVQIARIVPQCFALWKHKSVIAEIVNCRKSEIVVVIQIKYSYG